MSLLTAPKTYAALAAFQAGDAVACAIPLPPIAELLDDLGVPESVRPVMPIAKAASAVGLAAVTRFPGLARLTTAMLTLYFVLAVGAHLRVRDFLRAIPAVSFLTLFAAMTAKGPDGS
ncbi:DoxX family protein [Mycobacterium kubicae]|uniref:DoxX family protein n=1 Tax=Mycobacterium kubicae TaxID=120959 RepID=UPI000801001D|nr:DoxX family protein [Mycobacterium kubicae]OBK43317.1 hypothetical protein A5657_05800 [Mycobacterium kubicae]